jgi:hypothetical protein
VNASESEITDFVCPAMLPGDDVVDLKGCGVQRSRQLAIFASILGRSRTSRIIPLSTGLC